MKTKHMPWDSYPLKIQAKMRARFERDREKLLSGHTEGVDYRHLPYGFWTCTDGRRVLFDRRYRAFLSWDPDNVVRRADPREWVEGIRSEEFFYKDDRNLNLNAKKGVEALQVWLAWPR